MENYFLPLFRWIKYSYLYYKSLLISRLPSKYDTKKLPPMAFIIGCGRSGTTILGKLLSIHPQIYYIFEPIYIWVAVEDFLDVTNFFRRTKAYMIIDQDKFTKMAQLRFKRIILRYFDSQRYSILIEKTPHNAMRIGYLEKLVPNSKYIHIVRNGFDVIKSIERLTKENTYRVAFKANYNQWWGRDFCKWKFLKEDGKRYNYFSEEVELLIDVRQMAAYEWLITLCEVDRWKKRLSERLFEITYEDLINHPEIILKNLCDYLSIEYDKNWLNKAKLLIKPPRAGKYTQELYLPPKMCDAFNAFQECYGFLGRAKYMKLCRC